MLSDTAMPWADHMGMKLPNARFQSLEDYMKLRACEKKSVIKYGEKVKAESPASVQSEQSVETKSSAGKESIETRRHRVEQY